MHLAAARVGLAAIPLLIPCPAQRPSQTALGENVLEHVMREHQVNGLGPDRFLSTSVRAPFPQP